MSGKKTAAAAVAAEKAVKTSTETTRSEPKYTVGKLREESISLFGVSKSAFDGAMYGHNETEYTIRETKDIIKEWLYGKGGKS